jgi:hypothetical protein
MPNLPFEYGTVHLYDELKFRAYRQKLLGFHNSSPIGPNVIDAYDISNKMQTTLKDAEIKRRALFSESSIYNHFGVIAQIYNTGFAGRIIAFFLKNWLIAIILFILLILKLIF